MMAPLFSLVFFPFEPRIRSCARHEQGKTIMSNDPFINPIEISLEELDCPNGNICLPNIESIIDHTLSANPYVRIKGEENVYHISERDTLIQHIKELLKEGE